MKRCDFRLKPRCGDFAVLRMLCSVDWRLVTDVSGQFIRSHLPRVEHSEKNLIHGLKNLAGDPRKLYQ